MKSKRMKKLSNNSGYWIPCSFSRVGVELKGVLSTNLNRLGPARELDKPVSFFLAPLIGLNTVLLNVGLNPVLFNPDKF